MNYAIFRSEPIYTLNDLAQIGSHNKREKKAYNSNPDIDLSKIKDKEQKKYYKNLKMKFALPDNRTEEEKERDFAEAFW